ncbi:MAG TPA: FtsW/RodA/SpoVE family cell cycle protein, partial [Acidimicrobiales bacterium]|nr:FtsW/RodA/SpoVE family cell cycle protein [Acidimicrobiales bacterium]
PDHHRGRADHDHGPAGVALRAALPRATRRTTELGLIVLAALVTGGAYALAGLGKTASLPADILPFLLVILGLLAASHIATRRLAPNADGVLLPVAGLLNGIGYVFIARLDTDKAALQALWTAVAVGAFIVTLVVVRRARDLEQYRYTFALLGVGLLLLPLLPVIGREINGSRIWIRMGPATFQPGEVAKLVLAIFFAGYLVEKRELLQTFTRRLGPVSLPDPKFLGPVLGAWGFSLVVMIFERDLGSSLLFFALFVSMLWVATARGIYLVLGLVLFSAGATIAFFAFDHVQNRVDIWLHPFEDAAGRGYQIVQALFAFGSGGVAGTGLSLGSPTKIPAVTTDFIFAAIGEELGLLGTTAIVVAFLLMVGVGLRIALQARSDFEKLLATGLTVILAVQTFIILGGVTRLVPLTGITLPFVSYGGSSLLANYVLLALLLRISGEPSSPRARAAAATASGGRPVTADPTVAR